MIIHHWEVSEDYFLNFTSKHTRKSYRNDLSKYFEFMFLHYPSITEFSLIKISHLLAYRNRLMEAGGNGGAAASNKTIARKMASLSSLFKYLLANQLITTNPMSTIKRPKPMAKRPTQALEAQSVLDILELAQANKTSGALHHFLLVAFFTTGLRKSELLYRKFGDIKKNNDFWVLEFEGKGGKRGVKRLHPLFMQAFEEYTNWMQEHNREVEKHDWLFQPTKNPSDPTNINKPLNPKTINEILTSYALKLGIGRITPHSARATFITRLLEQGVDLYVVSNEVGHSSVTTTQIYDKRRKDLTDSPVTKLKYGT